MPAAGKSSPAVAAVTIDVHRRVYPPAYIATLQANGSNPGTGDVHPQSIETDENLSPEMAIDAAILSCNLLGVEVDSDPCISRRLVRSCNDYCARFRDSNPNQRGFFAALPSFLYTQAVLEEISYALDSLHADGVALMTRYGTGNAYLGHPAFIPIWKTLNARRAVVFILPTAPASHRSQEPSLDRASTDPLWDRGHEVGKTAVDLIASNTLRDCAVDCKIILSHTGGTLPYLIERASSLLPPDYLEARTQEEFASEAQTFYYCTAGETSARQMNALQKLFKGSCELDDHLLFGSDSHDPSSTDLARMAANLEAIIRAGKSRENALVLFPRLLRRRERDSGYSGSERMSRTAE